MSSLDRSILKTLAYADLFDYPLTASQVHQYLISSQKYRLDEVNQALASDKLLTQVDREGGYFFLKGRRGLVEERKQRAESGRRKMKIAKKAGGWLKLIPWVRMVAVTGALSMNNAVLKDDIDLLLVTRKNRLWLSRFFTILLIELVAKRRHPADRDFQDKICLNLFLAEDSLKIRSARRDLFTAHEVVQVQPLWERGGVRQRFYFQNRWVRKHLPNAIKERDLKKPLAVRQKGSFFGLDLLDGLMFNLQKKYMAPKITSEIVERNRVFFHPKSGRGRVLRQYHERLGHLKLT